jgi:type IV secretion system protein VirB10
MRRLTLFCLTCLLAALPAAAQDPARDFSGAWKLDRSRTHITDTSVPADASIRVEQSATSVTVIAEPPNGGPAAISIYPFDSRSQKYRTGDLQKSAVSKWEGDALLVNIIVSGPGNGPSANYTVFERWSKSRDGSTLTIERDITRPSRETESELVYVKPDFVYFNAAAPIAVAPAPRPPQTLLTRPTAPPPPAPHEYIVPAGTHILLRLTNAVNTKSTTTGDRIYLETAVPVFINGHLIIPQGSYVNGRVADAKSAGRVKGKAELALEYDSITLRTTGISRDLRSRPDSVDTVGNLNKSEGKIEGEGSKGEDAGRVARTTAVGTGVGTMIGAAAGHVGAGAGLGAAGGAIAGLASVFGSRGKQVVLPAGTTMDMRLDRDLHFIDDDLRPNVR